MRFELKAGNNNITAYRIGNMTFHWNNRYKRHCIEVKDKLLLVDICYVTTIFHPV